jgi:nucleoside-diphosphate-sugar epimerase
LLDESPKVSSPNSVRDFIFIEDVIDAYMKIIETLDISGQIFNIGYGQQHSVDYVVNKIIELIGNKVKPKWGAIPKRLNEAAFWQANISKSKDILKWEPKYSIDEGLKKTVEWFRENIHLYEGGRQDE